MHVCCSFLSLKLFSTVLHFFEACSSSTWVLLILLFESKHFLNMGIFVNPLSACRFLHTKDLEDWSTHLWVYQETADLFFPFGACLCVISYVLSLKLLWQFTYLNKLCYLFFLMLHCTPRFHEPFLCELEKRASIILYTLDPLYLQVWGVKVAVFPSEIKAFLLVDYS